MKNIKLKLSIIIAIIIALVTAYGMFQYKSIATVTNEMVSVGIGDPPEFPYITYNDLVEMYNILCCQKGTALPGYSSTIVSAGGEESSEPYLTMNDIGKKLFEKTKKASGYTTSDSFTNPYGSTTSKTYGYYKKSSAKSTSPAESYILAEMSENTPGSSGSMYNITNQVYTGKVTKDITISIGGKTLYGVDLSEGDDGYVKAGKFVIKGEDGKYYYVQLAGDTQYFPYTYVQYAWWTTPAGGSTTVGATSLQKEAEAFEAYIKKVAKKDANGNIVTERRTVTVNGKQVTVTAPVIDFKTSKDTSKAKAYYDETQKKYLVGPFTITYYEESVTSSRGTIHFSQIINATLESNLGKVAEEEWKFVYPNRNESDKAAYPHTGEEFYIVVDYIEGMTAIKDLHFTFKYMNAGGEYASLTGEFFVATWEGESEAVWCDEETSYCECGGTSEGPHRKQYDSEGNFTGYGCSGGAKKCSHGYYHKHIVQWNYWLELKDLDPQQSQTLAEGLVAARWYEEASLSLFIDLPDFVEVSGKKTWNDNGDPNRPEKITVTLYANGVSTGKSVETNAEKEWKYSFKNLSHYDENGNEIIYTVVETGIEGYSTTYNQYDIINTPDEPETVDVSGTKTWKDNNNADGIRPTKVKVTLYRNGKATNKTVTMTEATGWKYSFKNLPKYDDNKKEIAYTVVEEVVEGYTVVYNGFDIVNTEGEPGIRLTIPMAGEVWIDTDPDKAHNTTYGYKDEEDKPYEKAEVYVYKVYERNGALVKRELAKAYEDDLKTQIKFPVYTDNTGKYSIPNILVPGTDEDEYQDCTISYDVVFMYDGQNYVASKFLPTAGGNASTYIKASKEEKKKYEKDSMAKENANTRDSFNRKFTKISGDTPINDEGKTKGKANGNGPELTLDYTSEEYKLSQNDNDSRRISTLVTTDSEGYIIPQYKMPATTRNGGITYPVNKRIAIEDADDTKQISVEISHGIKTVTYKTIYNYMQHINLGVRERDDADLALGKDLYKAQLVVNEKALTYKYNTLYDFEDPENKDLLDIQLEAAKSEKYTLGLYSSDYAYRSKVYSKAADVVKKIKKDTELRVFLTYKVVVYNESEGYDEIVNELADYYDATFTTVDKNIEVNVLDNNGNRQKKTVAESTYYRVIPGGEVAPYKYNSAEDIAGYKNGTVSWNQVSANNSSETSDYKEMRTESLNNLKLGVGERAEIFVTFEVDRNGFKDKNSTERPKLLGEKNNIAEITNYSTYYKNGKVAGRVDKDSAPDNINFKKNVKAWYEDDTESAPAINIELYGYNRETNGLVWEDKETNELKYSQKVGDGKYDSDKEEGISNIDVQLIEKISIDNIEYEYLWPADAFQGMKDAGEYNPTDVTKNGKYTLKGFVAGNYVVRFKYGNRDDSIKYNGQDYKNTAYQVDMKNSDGTTTLNNEWHDLKDETLRKARVSDARDYELQRMKVVAYSRKISNSVGSVLETADNKAVNHAELIANTQMVANTAKLNLELERQDYIDYGTEKLVDGIKEYTYVVGNIDFGLEKRSETVIDLTKDLRGITLYKDNGSTEIMKVTINEDGTINYDMSLELSKLLRIPKQENAQGFSYIIMEEQYLRDLTIKLEYNIKVVNNSEVDWTGLLSEYSDTETAAEEILDEVKMLEEQEDYVSGKGIVYGDYVGLNYYNNKNNDSDVMVKTKIEKVIDYIDPNISIDAEASGTNPNSSWANISTEELQTNKLLADKVYTVKADGTKVIADEKGNIFDSDSIKNLYVNSSREFNPSLLSDLIPTSAKSVGEPTFGEIKMVTSKTSTSEEAAEDLLFNNIAEILTYSNTVGRRDMQSVPGNAEIARGEFTAATGYDEISKDLVLDYEGGKEVSNAGTNYHLNGERDTDAAEFVTFTDPTGKSGMTSKDRTNLIYLVVILIAGIATAVGIFTIKVKVVDTDKKESK